MDFQLLFFGRFYYTFGYFLLGLWIGKVGLFSNLPTVDFTKKKPIDSPETASVADEMPLIEVAEIPEEKWPNLAFVKKTLLWSTGGLVLSVLLTGGVFNQAPQPIDFTHWMHVLGINFSDMINLFLALIILCSFTLLYQKRWWHNKLAYFAPYGRMALTNYILQSILGTFLLFGWGLGFFGTLRTLYLFGVALSLIIFQSWFSKLWLERFKYGPLEWLWRSGTYFKWQPFRK